jgi:hypothetical protein
MTALGNKTLACFLTSLLYQPGPNVEKTKKKSVHIKIIAFPDTLEVAYSITRFCLFFSILPYHLKVRAVVHSVGPLL